MHHLHEIIKIIEGGIQRKSDKVSAYAKLLADKLENDGDHKASKNIRSRLDANKLNDGGTFSPSGQTDFHHIPVDKDSRLSLADTCYPQVEKTIFQLEQESQHIVSEFINFVDHRVQLEEAGVGISPSMLIYGPPGCGKTALAHKIAADLKLPLLTARCDTLVSSYLGSTAKNIRSLFDHAAERPCILFLDEFDALAKARDDQHELGELKRVVVSLLQNIDALPGDNILLAATNHETLLDPAVWRRFAYRLHMQLPSTSLREALITQFLANFLPKNIKSIVQVTDGMSGALIRQACEASIRTAVLKNSKSIDESDLLNRLIRMQYHDILSNEQNEIDKINRLREINPKLFTTRQLGKLFSISTGKVSNILNRKEAVTGHG